VRGGRKNTTESSYPRTNKPNLEATGTYKTAKAAEERVRSPLGPSQMKKHSQLPSRIPWPNTSRRADRLKKEKMLWKKLKLGIG